MTDQMRPEGVILSRLQPAKDLAGSAGDLRFISV